MKGIDVSHYQGIIDWPIVAASGIQFAICKATQGITVQDPLFRRNIIGAKAAGILTGAYHFFNPMSDAKEQADNFLNQFVDTDFPMMLALDLEGPNWDGFGAMQRGEMVEVFLDYVEERRGRPMIYTSPAFARQYLQTVLFGLYKMWVADYAENIPAGWANYAIWQEKADARIPGIPGKDVDYDISSVDFSILMLRGKRSNDI